MQTFEKYLLSVHSALTLVGTGDTVMNKTQFIVQFIELTLEKESIAPSVQMLISLHWLREVAKGQRPTRG